MSNYTIFSSFDDPPETEEKTVPELLLQRVQKHVEMGKTRRIVRNNLNIVIQADKNINIVYMT